MLIDVVNAFDAVSLLVVTCHIEMHGQRLPLCSRRSLHLSPVTQHGNTCISARLFHKLKVSFVSWDTYLRSLGDDEKGWRTLPRNVSIRMEWEGVVMVRKHLLLL